MTYKMTNISISSGSGAHACCCVGPQNGEPMCPCEMRSRGIFKRNGRWVEPARGEKDIGPVFDVPDTSSRER